MGKRAVMIIILEKKTDLACLLAVFLMIPILLIKLKAGIPTSFAFLSNMTKSPSVITTAPSTIIPKSIAPIDRRLALIPIIYRQINANNNANGIITATITVVLQSAIKIKMTKMTNTSPSVRFFVTVCIARCTRSSRS